MGKVLKVEPNFPLYTGSSTPRIAQSPCNISKSKIHATGKVFSLFSKLWQMEKIISLLSLISCITSYSGVIRIGISSKRIQKKTPNLGNQDLSNNKYLKFSQRYHICGNFIVHIKFLIFLCSLEVNILHYWRELFIR